MRQPLSRKDKPRIDLSSVRNILIIRLRRIGDIVMTFPALSVLRDAYPEVRVTYVVESSYKDLVEGHPLVDKILVLPQSLKRREFFRFIRKIRKDKYDVVLDFHGGPKAFWMTLFSGAQLKVGYRVKYKNFIYDVKVPRGPKSGYIHSVANHVNIVKALGIQPLSIPRITFPHPVPEEVEPMEAFLRKNKVEKKSYCVIHIGAGNAFRFWGVKNLAALTEMLTDRAGVQIIFVGAAGDRSTEEDLKKNAPPSVYSLVGRINLKQLYWIISQAALFIGPDSGPMHMAAATDTPIVAVFGPQLPAIFGPWRAMSVILEQKLECRPCDQRKCRYGDFRCLLRTTPEDVYKASLPFLRLHSA